MAPQSEARRRLAALMDERRLELRLTWQEVAERGGVSLRAIANARTGNVEIRPLTQAGIEAGLDWGQGTIERVLAGGEPLGHAPVAPLPDTGPRTFPPMSPEMERDSARHEAELLMRLEIAQRMHPGEKLTGAMVFPDDVRSARSWDSLTSAFVGWAPEQVAKGLAVMRADIEAMEARRRASG